MKLPPDDGWLHCEVWFGLLFAYFWQPFEFLPVDVYSVSLI